MLNAALSRMEQVFQPQVLEHAVQYHAAGRVLSVRFSEGLVRARVRGSASHLYDVYLDLRSWPQVPSRCSCTQVRNCKHAAAALLALREKDTTGQITAVLPGWLRDAQTLPAHPEPPPATHVIVYLLTLPVRQVFPRLYLQLATARRLKRGGWGKPSVFHELTESRRKLFDATDEALLSPLLFNKPFPVMLDAFSIQKSTELQSLLASGRTGMNMEGEAVWLRLGEARAGEWVWRLEPDGQQRLMLESQGEVLRALQLDGLWYVDTDEGVLGPLDTPFSPEENAWMLKMPRIPQAAALETARDIEARFPNLPRPTVWEHASRRQAPPRPQAVFDAELLGEASTALFKAMEYEGQLYQLRVRLSFEYAGIPAAFGSGADSYFMMANGELIEWMRDTRFECEAFETLAGVLGLTGAQFLEAGTATVGEWSMPPAFHTPEGMQLLCVEAIPALRQSGWNVVCAHPLYEEVLDADAFTWYSALEGGDNDFFAFESGIEVDGERISMVPVVANLLRTMDAHALESMPEETLLRLPVSRGRAMSIPYGRIKPLLFLLLQTGFGKKSPDNRLQLTRYQLMLAMESARALRATMARWHGVDVMRERLQALQSRAGLPSVAPARGLEATLRDYQIEGLQWLQGLREAGLGGVLADDMGLGKTVQTLAHLLYEKEQGRLQKPCLILAPKSLVTNWFEEAARFTPGLSCHIYHGSGRDKNAFQGNDVIISTYGLLQRDKALFLGCDFYYVILDEAQCIKNARTQTTQVAQQLHAEHRLCLSGTPLENHLGELWSLFHFLMPGLLGDARSFRTLFRIPIEKEHDVARRALLARRVHPFLLRRTKSAVIAELPPKTEITHHIQLEGAQRDVYEMVRISMEQKVREAIAAQGVEKSHIVLLDALLKLRQICCSPRLLKWPDAHFEAIGSAKLDALLTLLDNLIREGRRVLVFSQFTSMLRLIAEALNARGYPYIELTGQSRDRGALVARFQQGDIPIFLISLKAGGTGLNLTRADTVIHYDPWWNPAVEDQATDRTHRLGQENPVFVYRLVAEGTVEDVILRMQARKRTLYEGILSSSSEGVKHLTDADIAEFFLPIVPASE